MKPTHVGVLTVFFTLIAATFVRAEVIVDNLNQPTSYYFGPIGSDSNNNDFLIGQEFSFPSGPNPFQLSEITLLLNATGAGAHITVSIWSVGPNNNPSNQIAVVASQFVTNTESANFVPSNNVILAPGIYYVVASPATSADNGRVNWAYAVSTNWTGLGTLWGYADTMTGQWEYLSITNLPQQMSVQAAPAPATVAIRRQGSVTTLSWPSAFNGYTVDSATNLTPAAWEAITNLPTLVAGTNILTQKGNNPAQFFRLRQSLVADNLNLPATDWDGPIGTDNDSNDFLIGQEFTLPAGNYMLNKVTLSLIPAYGNASVTASLWSAGADNNPDSQIAVIASQSVTSTGNVNFIPSTPISLPSGTYYVVVGPTTPADNAKVGWYWTTSTTWIGFGWLDSIAATYAGYWENAPLSEGPYLMNVQVTPAPP